MSILFAAIGIVLFGIAYGGIKWYRTQCHNLTVLHRVLNKRRRSTD